MFLDTDLGSELLDMTPKAQATEDKQTKWTLGKYLNFVHPKLLYIHRVKRPPTE